MYIMKKLLLSFVAVLFVFGTKATIIQVNNNTGASADFALLQQAIDAANSGDTLYVAGSPNYYDGNDLIRLNKTLTIIGPGYFLGENGQTQSSNQTAKISRMEIGEGASNSVLMGLDLCSSKGDLYFSKDKRDGTIGTAAADNVTIKRNIIFSITLNYASGTILSQNFFLGSTNNLNLYYSASNTLIQNNIFDSGTQYASISGDYNHELSNTVIINNTFENGLSDVHGAEISNNVFHNGSLKNCENNTVKNNVFVAAEGVAIPSTSTGNTSLNNVFSVTAADLFVESTPTVDNDFILKTNSPALGAGLDGIDAGAFGGLNAYKLSGLPPIPSIYELNTNGIGTKENGLGVTLKAKSNN